MDTTASKPMKSLSFSGDEDTERLIVLLTFHSGQTNKSQTIRAALFEKAERDLGADWRDRLALAANVRVA